MGKILSNNVILMQGRLLHDLNSGFKIVGVVLGYHRHTALSGGQQQQKHTVRFILIQLTKTGG